MNYKTLLKLIQDMSPEQQEMDVVVATMEDNIIITMLYQVIVNEDTSEEALPEGQPILS